MKEEAWCRGGAVSVCACPVPPMSGTLEEVELFSGAVCGEEKRGVVVHTVVVDVTDKNEITMGMLKRNRED